MLMPATARSRMLALLAGAAISLGAVAPVLAEHEPPRLGLTPIDDDWPYFDLSLDPGTSAQLEVEVANFGHDAVLARTFVVDAYSIINGGFGAELFGEPISGTSRWLDFATNEIRLEPGDSMVIEFTVTVPADALPGEYITALVAENADPYIGPEQDGLAVEQVNRAAVAVAIDVPGPRAPALEIGAVGHKLAAETSFVTFAVTNPGNVHLRPSGEFALRAADGAEVASAPAVMDSVYAGTATLFETGLGRALPPGDYCAELRLTDEETGATDETGCLPFTVAAPAEAPGPGAIPIIQPAIDAVAGSPLLALALAVLLAVLAALVMAWLLLRRRRRQDREAEGVPALMGPAEPSWPAADGVAAHVPRRVGRNSEAILRAVLAELREVTRAWVIDEAGEPVLVIEVAPGTEAAEGTQLARSLQAEMRAGGPELGIRTRFVRGSGPVTRTTGGTAPFYVRAMPGTYGREPAGSGSRPIDATDHR